MQWFSFGWREREREGSVKVSPPGKWTDWQRKRKIRASKFKLDSLPRKRKDSFQSSFQSSAFPVLRVKYVFLTPSLLLSIFPLAMIFVAFSVILFLYLEVTFLFKSCSLLLWISCRISLKRTLLLFNSSLSHVKMSSVFVASKGNCVADFVSWFEWIKGQLPVFCALLLSLHPFFSFFDGDNNFFDFDGREEKLCETFQYCSNTLTVLQFVERHNIRESYSLMLSQ